MTIQLHIAFDVEGDLGRVSDWFVREYLPALREQDGFQDAHLLRAYPEEQRTAIGAAVPSYPCLISIQFDSEPQRARWEASSAHQRVWSRFEGLASYGHHVGWDVLQRDGANR